MKKLLLYSLLLTSGVVASARSLSPAEALGRLPGMAMSRSAEVMDPVMTVGTADAPTLYVFNRPDGGWMIVSADDVAAPLLGYSDTGSFDSANLPDNFKGWIESYDRQISAAAAAGSTAYRPSRSADERTPIAPLVKTQWNQGSPYNLDCPKFNNISTYTGCVATAMAQVMKYYNWPPKASENATFDYKADGVSFTADFSNYEFDWDNMLDRYTTFSTEQANAVSKLMQACGYSIFMRYGTYASAAYNEMVGNALVTYYDYDYSLHNEYRAYHSSDAWENMIYDNLQNVGPMVYWGGAHCFVCDGYDKDGLFHFNWGWGGMQDGYFLLTALAPGAGGIGSGTGDYTMNQGALLGIKPSTGDDSQRQYTFRIDELNSVSASSSTLTILGKFANNSPYTVGGKVVYQVYSLDGTTKLTSCPTYTAFASWGIDTKTGNTTYLTQLIGSITGIPNGTYRVYPAIEIDGTEYSFQTPATIAGYIVVDYANGKLTSAEIPSTGELVIDDLSTNGDFYVKSKIKISGIAKFTGNGDTNTSITACLLREDGSVRANSTSPITLNFSEDGTPFEFIIPWFENDKSLAVAAGDYTFGLAIAENGLYKMLGTCPVKVYDQVITPTCTATVAVENPEAVDPENIKVTATFTGTAGVISDYFNLQLFRSSNNNVSSNLITNQWLDMYFSAGQTVTAERSFSLPDAVAGETYNVTLRDSRYKELKKVVFTIGEKSGIETVEADNEAPAEYFNLQGQPVNGDNLIPGIYIMRKGNEVKKVMIK